MDKFVVAVFPTEAKAYEGSRAMQELKAEGSLTLYAMAIVTRTDGKLSVKQTTSEGPAGAGLGALLGGLVGLFGGPAGAGLGLLAGGFIGGWADLFNMGVDKDFLDKITIELKPGKSAVVAEVDEEWITPLDTRMEALGGTLLRQARADFEVDRIRQAVQASEAELSRIEAEYRQAREADRARLKVRMEAAKATLRARAAAANDKRERLRQEQDAKIKALREQLARAKPESLAVTEQRITDYRVDYDARATKLEEAVKSMEHALAS
jgi:uncharacterized membrane protein